MDFNRRLNEIIFKYDIDKICPNYRKYINAVALAKTIYSSVKEKEKEVLLLGIDQMDIRAFLTSVRDEDNCIIKLYKEIDGIQSGATVLLVSYYQKDQIVVSLQERSVNIISLYDYFEENNLEFSHNFYDIYNEQYWDNAQGKWAYEYGNIDVNRVYFYHRRRYETAQEEEKKKLYLEKMIFDCVYVKDFLTLKENIDEYSLEFREQAERYISFYKEIESLLEELKSSLEARNAKDFIVFWLDMLEYGMDETMPFLKGLDKKSLVFNKAFTVTPYTSPTLLTLLTGMCQIEDETYYVTRIDAADNTLARELQARNYSLKYYGNSLNHWMDQDFLPPHFYRSNFYSFTQLYWDVLTDLTDDAGETKNKFSILHELFHTHYPLISYGIKGTQYIMNYRDEKLTKKGGERLKKQQQMESREYVDRQLEFWSNILPDRTYKIYMSDHGVSLLGRFHTIMKVQQKDIDSHVCNDLFSYTNFLSMILQLIDNQIIDENSISSEFALIQEVAWYNRERVLEVAAQKDYYSEHQEYLGVQGVVTEEDMLITYGKQFEYYQKHKNDHNMVSDDRLNYLRGLVSKKEVDYFHIDKFRYTRILITAAERRTERTRNIQMRKREVIESIFDQIQDTEILALRGGGFHTLHLLMQLKEQLRNKVKYIIDGNSECVGGKMGIEVITLNEMLKKGITTVLISSYQYLQKWEDEMKSYEGVRIINIYRILEEHGLPCEMEFCFEKFIDEDFDLSLADA